MSDKALLVLKHMRMQIRMQGLYGTPAASVWRAARAIGVKLEEDEFDALLKGLLRGGYMNLTQAPALPRTGCTDLPIRAYLRLRRQIAPLRYGKVSGGRTEALVAQIDREGALRCNNAANSCSRSYA